jgi:hypothetical protein
MSSMSSRMIVALGAGVLACVGAAACTSLLGDLPAGILLDAGSDVSSPAADGGQDSSVNEAAAGDSGPDTGAMAADTGAHPGDGEAGPPACGPGTCAGCCDPNGTCIAAPVDAGMCGFGGNACATCTGAATCTDGVCLGCSAPTAILAAATNDNSVGGFPSAVAVSGTNIVVGANGSSGGVGLAFIFTPSGSTWANTATLSPGGACSQFGTTVAISGSVAMVGALEGTSPVVFEYNQVGSSWFNGQTIQAPVTDAGYGEPPAIALQGSTALIGSGTGLAPPAVYALSGSTWALQGTLTPGEPIPDLYSGNVLALDGDTAVVGVSSTNTQGETARWADVFVRTGTTWAQQASLAPTGLQANNNPHFQFSLGISGNTLVMAWNSGAYVYNRSGAAWTQQATTQDAGLDIVPVPSDGLFGSSAASTPGGILVGDTAGYNGGTVFLYGLTSTGWQQVTLQPFDDAGAGGPLNYGTSVARSGSLAVVASPGNTQYVPAGAFEVYTCSP